MIIETLVGSLSGAAVALFALNPKSRTIGRSVYWVIEENEENHNTSVVKYYSEENELLFEEEMSVQLGFIDDDTMAHLNRTKAKVQQKISKASNH